MDERESYASFVDSFTSDKLDECLITRRVEALKTVCADALAWAGACAGFPYATLGQDLFPLQPLGSLRTRFSVRFFRLCSQAGFCAGHWRTDTNGACFEIPCFGNALRGLPLLLGDVWEKLHPINWVCTCERANTHEPPLIYSMWNVKSQFG